ncbi:MAG: hypothetical protein PHP69_03810 [Candidatus Omnitrophica bacterium]|nr:hypothetical protein [Candidatus Omnitrophota bacterium]
MSNKKAINLIEILVCLVIIGLGVTVSMRIMVNGKIFCKNSEIKSDAMRVASLQMERLLAQSYDTLKTGCSDFFGCDDIINYYSGSENGISWDVSVEQKEEGDGCGGLSGKCIPYKEITTTALYREEPLSADKYRRVYLKNIVSYPYIHIKQMSLNAVDDFVGAGGYTVVGDSADSLRIEIDYPIKKNIIVLYNIALDVEDSSGIQPVDTIFTKCFMDGYGKNVVTRTPIITQPLINNMIEIHNVEPGEHVIEVKWYKDTTQGSINLKKANLILIAFEGDK